jgi:heme A synthase
MSTALLRLLESVHGHLGVLAAVALLHPTILLWRGRPATRGVRWSIGLTTFLVAAAYAAGIAIYGDYRQLVKRPLFRDDVAAGLLFETKEHLAFVALVLTLGAVWPSLAKGPEGEPQRRMAARLWAGAALACWLVGAMGTWVQSLRGF